ncbi:MAG: hypothetical protein M3132_05315 [Actinomycetia bacterium]|nr:hypothetical protein [Actinomycetes bacterium]
MTAEGFRLPVEAIDTSDIDKLNRAQETVNYARSSMIDSAGRFMAEN